MAVATMFQHDLHFGVAQGHGLLAQSVARGAVDNMELVLSDLQGIMGNIQSLISHIDSVTCRSGRRARNRRQETHDGQEQRDGGESHGGAETQAGQAVEYKAAKPGESSKDGVSSPQHCTQEPLDVNASSISSSPQEPKTAQHSQGAVFKRPKNHNNGQKKISKRFSDSVLQEASSYPKRETLGSKLNESKVLMKRSSALLSPENAIFNVQPIRQLDCGGEANKINQRDNIAVVFGELKAPEDIDFSWTQSKKSTAEPCVAPGCSPTRRPIYRRHVRDDSLASRGEYDLETLEARLGNRADFSDGDQSRLSLEDSPLRLRYSSKTKRDMISSSGSVAVVYPIVKTQSVEMSTKERLLNSPDDIDYYGRHRVCKAAFSPKQVYQVSVGGRVNNIPDGYEIPIESGFKGNELTKAFRQTYVYNKAFVPVTPTEHNPLSTLQKCVGPWNLSESPKRVLQSGHYLNHSSLPNSPKVKRSTAGRVGFDFDTFDANKNRLHSRPIYARIEGSPASTRSSSSTVRKPVAHHYYYSIDSDLDSDLMPEYLDPRGLTPDLDWSYLNLIGSDVLGNLFPVEGKETFDNAYETPIPLFRDEQRLDASHKSPDAANIVPFYHILSSKHSSTPSDSSAENKESANAAYEEPTSSPLTCNGTNDRNEYCGCYEAYLDSVLENVAGFETFEEALDGLTYDDILSEAYISFDDQFEEDDWDVGLESENSLGFSIDFEDSNGMAFSDFFSEKSFDIHTVSSSRSVNRPCVLSLSKHLIPDGARCKNKRNLSPKNDLTESREKARLQGDSDISDSLSNHSQYDQTVPMPSSPCTKSSVDSLSDELKFEDPKSPLFGDESCSKLMSESYDTSCRAVASDSPMSLCSSEAAENSPTSDRFITSSEGDDLFTSHDESYFQLSPASPGSASVDNVRANQFYGKTKTSELTQQFLMSLRALYERHSGAGVDSKSVSGEDEDPEANINKSRDSSSSGLSSTNSSTITASISTATDTTLTDDNLADDSTEQNPCPPCANNTMCNEVGSSSPNDDTITRSGYNRNVNTWTAYTVVHVQADDISESTSSEVLFNDNILGSMYSMTASHVSNDNDEAVPSNHKNSLL